MDTPSVVRFFHLLAAAVWTGGLIVMAALVVALRRAGAERPMIQAAARQFARVSWVAMAVAVATGVYQVMLMNLPWTYGRLHMKMGLVGLVVVVTVVHQIVAKRLPPAGRGAVEGTILLLSLGIFAAAVAL